MLHNRDDGSYFTVGTKHTILPRILDTFRSVILGNTHRLSGIYHGALARVTAGAPQTDDAVPLAHFFWKYAHPVQVSVSQEGRKRNNKQIIVSSEYK